MTKCCLCNSSGRCKSCRCTTQGKRCTNCNPLHHDRCMNWKSPDDSNDQDLSTSACASTSTTIASASTRDSLLRLANSTDSTQRLTYAQVCSMSPSFTSSQITSSCPTLSLISHVTPHPCANTVDPPKNKLQLNSSNQSSKNRCATSSRFRLQ